MALSRRALIASLPSIAIATSAKAYENCYPQFVQGIGPTTICDVGIDLGKLAEAEDPQFASQWCWAASVSNIFDLYGFEVSQATIVQTVYGQLVNLPAFDTTTISRLLSRDWNDESGKSFRCRIRGIFDAYSGASTLDNRRIISALRSERPLLFCNRSHAMVLTAMTYTQTPMGPFVLNVGFFDPWPGRGLRGPDHPLEAHPVHSGGHMTYLALPEITPL
ncbi:MAG: hypothetical protein J0H39_16440 [Alphaproteobacteria bacterium]|nr:hypothetical protein [Alphaproteobacteria bacterium]